MRPGFSVRFGSAAHAHTQTLYLPHGHCICRTDPVSAAQTLYLPRRHCICHTDTVSAYLPHRHSVCRTYTISTTQTRYPLQRTPHLPHRSCIWCAYSVPTSAQRSICARICCSRMRPKVLFDDASRFLGPVRLGYASENTVRRCVPVSLFSVSLCSVVFTSRMECTGAAQ